MRFDGLWHPRLLAVLAQAGHGDRIVIADAGLPVPAGVETIDLLWRRGEPPFLAVLRAVLDECVVERATVAVESDGSWDVLRDIPTDIVPHDELKRLTQHARVVVRTGEATPYANVVLHAGVAF
ncbi:D-ribose pyranase [Micromonospora sp. DR5-3]|uniref:D-ribose pyranase n=1 Tax=unclassified Micromonospora TaxID=2617518 RepID=UPI0011D890D3|nr:MULTISPECIES: D-ribose pyranase [unclassified Micromonospora]MCW3819045.1 D-ribose pyranase [Micromonospora sp. DR5-3]TYC17201.1 D-ribose pyranase [Micromonospora sp. MP36]